MTTRDIDNSPRLWFKGWSIRKEMDMALMTVSDLIEQLRQFPSDKLVGIEPHDLSRSSDVAGIRNDEDGDIPRVYIQFWGV